MEKKPVPKDDPANLRPAQPEHGSANGQGDEPIDEVPLYRKRKIVIPLAVVVVLGVAVAWYWYVNLRDFVSTDDAYVDANRVSISSKILGRISRLSVDDQAAFLADLGLPDRALDRLLRAAYALLGLISFLTAGEDECRAWSIPAGTGAAKAAGAIHSDFERGFIRAEVVPWQKLLDAGSFAACRTQGVLRLEGKDYVVQDGDVITFRFNV